MTVKTLVEAVNLHSLQCWDEDGNAVEPGTESGELVCATPFPSMPVRFWNDADGEKYRKAYFAKYPERCAMYKLTTNHSNYFMKEDISTLFSFEYCKNSSSVARIYDLPKNEKKAALPRVIRGVGGWFIRPKKFLTPSGDESSRNRLKI